jgi:carboxylesterase
MYHPIIKTAEPFFYPGNRTGVLLVHGLTGAPKEMRWMGEFLTHQGFTVLGIRLAGHATHQEDLKHIHWEDWLHSVEDGFHLLRGITDQVYIAGLSLGGVLTVVSSALLPVQGGVIISTPYEFPADPRLPFLQYLQWLKPTIAKDLPDWRNPEAAADHVEYPVHLTHAITELRDLVVEMHRLMPEVRSPVLVVQSRLDEVIGKDAADKFITGLGSRDKQVLWVENSGHCITREPDRELVFRATAAFIERVNGMDS